MKERALSAETMDGVIDRIADVLREELSAISLPAPVVRTPPALRAACAAMREAEAQVPLLQALLEGAHAAGARAALFVVKADHVEGWEGIGFDDLELHGQRLSRDEEAVSALLAEQRTLTLGEEAGMAPPDFGQTPRSTALLIPLLVHGKLVAFLYVDEREGTSLDATSVEVMGEVAALAIERLALSRWSQKADIAPARAETQPPAEPPARAAASDVPAAEQNAPTGPSGPIGTSIGPESGAVSVSPEVQDARRFARLLMEEICLYHADKVDEGRVQADLLARLSEPLDRARQMYEQRVPADVRALGDFFEEALVRVLAGGEASALGSVDRAAI